jgi:hypothetical protein
MHVCRAQHSGAVLSVRKAQDTDGLAQRRSEGRTHGRGGRLAMESVAALPWNTQALSPASIYPHHRYTGYVPFP